MMHTPGPWTVTPRAVGGFEVTANDADEAGAFVESVAVCHRWDNAALVAAAPAMLAALEACVCAMQDYQAGIGITEMFDKGERMGRAAIAQATGDA